MIISNGMEMVKQVCDAITKRVDRKYIRECARTGTFPQKLVDLIADGGLYQMGVPEEFGGVGGGITEMVYAIDLLSQAGLEPAILTPNCLARVPIIKYGTEEQKRKYIPGTTTGEILFAFCITEPNAGTNSFKIETLAKPQPDGNYLLNGQKLFITGFADAQYALLVARTIPYKEVTNRREGLSLFIIDTKMPGIEAHLQPIGLGLADKQYTVFFNDVVLPKECLIGEEGKGFHYLFDGLNPERLFAAAMSVGTGDYILKKAVEYAKIRDPFDAPIGSYQSLQHPMAYAKIHIEGARTMMYKASMEFDEGKKIGTEANYAKILSADAHFEAADIAMQVHGGYAADEDTDLLTLFTQARMSKVAPANNQLILNFVGEHVLGLPKSY